MSPAVASALADLDVRLRAFDELRKALDAGDLVRAERAYGASPAWLWPATAPVALRELRDLAAVERVSPLGALELAGYPSTVTGLIDALGDLGEARSSLATLLADPNSATALQGARAHLDAAMARRGAR